MIYVLQTETYRRHNFSVTHYAYFTDEGEAFDAIETLADTAREAIGDGVTHVEWVLMEADAGKLFTDPTVTRAGCMFPDTDARD